MAYLVAPGVGAAREHRDARLHRVLQEPVGLVGAQRVVLGDEVLIADDPPQVLYQRHTTIHDNTLVLCRSTSTHMIRISTRLHPMTLRKMSPS